MDPVSQKVLPTDEPVDENAQPEMEVPFNLDNVRRHLAEVCFARKVLPEDIAARQKLLEESVYEVAVSRLRKESETFEKLGIKDGQFRDAGLKKLLWEWHVSLKAKLETLIPQIKEEESHVQQGSGRRANLTPLSPFLSLIDATRLSLITIMAIMKYQNSGGVSGGMKTTRGLLAVGTSIEMEYKTQMCRKSNIYIPTNKPLNPSTQPFFSSLGYRNLQERRIATAKFMSDGESWTANWTQTTRIRVGAILVQCLMDTAKVVRKGIDPETGEEM
jgi:DNA-directed RNA polymerase, mitochondrial